MARRSDLRASDADREQVAERLRQATVEGRLAAHELEQRIGRALRARTYGELNATVADLPGPGRGRTRGRPQRAFTVMRAHPVLIALAIPLALVAVAALLTIAIVWATLMFVAAVLLGHGRPGMRIAGASRRVGRLSASRRHATGGPWL